MVPRTRKTTGTRTGIGRAIALFVVLLFEGAIGEPEFGRIQGRTNQKMTTLHETPKENESYHDHQASPPSTGNLREQKSPKEEADTHRETEEVTDAMSYRIQDAALRDYLDNESGATYSSVSSSGAGAKISLGKKS